VSARVHAKFLRVALLALIVAGCGVTPRRAEPPRETKPNAEVPPARRDILSIPDAVPRVEPRSRNGNPPFYTVLGKRYYVLPSAVGYVERGVASWYGPGFHAVRTSTGEPYDMYGMSAAHKTLPLPAYARVTNLQNGRSVVVRINDRGPFVANRVIDLSYTAAAKLDMLRNGTAMVEVRAISPDTAFAPPPPPAALFIQAGAFADPANAARLAGRLRTDGYGDVLVRDSVAAGRRIYRVRIGPVATVAEFDRISGALERAGISGAHLALD
jgi:rare lipoprotein A